MRLICGVLSLNDTPPSALLIDRMVAQLDVPRLRPTRSDFRDGALAMAALDFSGDSGSALPRSGAYVIAADVRFDEPEGLAQSLTLDAQDQSALLLEAVRQSGSPEAVLGDFAFALWDGNRETLRCGRDIFGVRPLSYVYRPGELFAFASLPAALHGSGIVPLALDTAVVVSRNARVYRLDDSPVAGIVRLKPGHMLTVSRSGLSLERYWGFDRAKLGTAQITQAEAAAQMRRLVEQAVRCRLPAEAAIGAHLSGGLDSSAIAILAARALREDGRRLHAYSFVERPRSDVTVEDESAFVKACVDQEAGIDWAAVCNTTSEFERPERLDPDLLNSLSPDVAENQVAAVAERQGVRLILSGWGGDEAATFNGRGAMAELLKRGRWGDLRRELAALARERGWSRRKTFVDEVVSYLANDHLPQGLLDRVRRMRGRKPALKQLLHGILAPGVPRAPDDDPSLWIVGDGRENRWRLIHGPHIPFRAEIWAQIGARHGLAYAFPLLDRRVVEFALSLPSDYFLSGGFRRRPFRDAMRDVLPEIVARRHRKYVAFPGRELDLAEARDSFAVRLDAYENDAAVARVMDLEQVRRLVAQLPSPSVVRDAIANGTPPPDRDIMLAVVRAMELAEYLQQHGPRAPADPDRPAA